MAHGNFSILKSMMKILDDERFDFYIHIDAKTETGGEERELLSICKKSKVYLTQRIAVYWGHYSQTQTQLLLIKAAMNNTEKYDYFHLVSGIDMPLKTPDEIDSFISKNIGSEFVTVWRTDNWRMKYKYPFIKKYKRSKNEIINKVKKGLISRVLRLPRTKEADIQKNKGWTVYCGDAWYSISYDLAEYLLFHEDEIMRYWKDCYIADECLLATIVKNTPEFERKMYPTNTREIRWENCVPHIWTKSDLPYLYKSTAIFARKFSLEHIDAVTQLEKELLKRKNA